MDKDSAAGPCRYGFRWLRLVASNPLRASPKFSGIHLLALLVQKVKASDFSTHVSRLLSVSNLIPLDKGEAIVQPIAIGIVLRRLSTRALMSAAVEEAKDYLLPTQVGFLVRCGTDAAVHDTRPLINEHGHDSTFILSSSAENAFNKASIKHMLNQAAAHAPSIIRLANALYAKGQP